MNAIDPAGAQDETALPRVLQSSNLEISGLIHGFFLRTGGVSEGVYASLNCGRGSKDHKEHVEENRARASAHLGILQAALAGPRQVHSPKAVIAVKPWQPGEAPEADAVVTNKRGLAVCVLTADCVPVLLADAKAGVVAAAHAGWKGAKAGVIENTIEAMESLGARVSRISAAIGPAISRESYEVGSEFEANFLATSDANGKYFSSGGNGRPHFDLPAYVKDRLQRRGVLNTQDIGVCTYKNESILFSYRRSVHRREHDYGRQISAILLG